MAGTQFDTKRPPREGDCRGKQETRCGTSRAVQEHAMNSFRRSNASIGLLMLALIALEFLLGCGSLVATNICDILKDPRRFDGKVVTVSGRVKDSAQKI